MIAPWVGIVLLGFDIDVPRTGVARVGAINNIDDFKSLLINTIN